MKRAFLQLSGLTLIVLAFAVAGLAQKSVKEYAALGNEQYKRKDYDNAIASQTECIRLYPRAKECRSIRGIVYEAKGKPDLAIADFNESIRIDPKHFLAYQGRGVTYFFLQKYDAAIADFETALQLNPNDQNIPKMLEIAKTEKSKEVKKEDSPLVKLDSGTSKSASLIDFETALSKARTQSNPSKYRAAALVQYHASLKSEGRTDDEVLQLTMQRIKELAETDFYAVFEVFLDRNLTQDFINKMLTLLPLDQKEAIKKMSQLFVSNFHLQRSGKEVTTLPEHLYKPGYGWGKTVSSNK